MAARYVIVMQQGGGGCDYTIGCGMQMVEIGFFDRPEQAIEAGTKKFRELHDYYGLGGEERQLSFVGTFCLVQDLTPLYQQIGSEKQEVADAEARAAKRQQLEQLKRELGEA